MEDLQDWEILDSSSVNSSLLEDGSDPESLILPDYFQIPSDSVLQSKQEFENSSNQVTDDDSVSEEIKEFVDEESSEDHEIGVNTEEIILDSNGDVSEKEVDDEVVETVEANGKQEIVGGELRRVDQGERGLILWWKVPVEILKFCVFRVSPVWTVSLAAAIMGVLILKRRLSRMKQKSRSIPIKLTVEDKKVSQFMMRASRANEAFSVVRRVPIFRPLLPSAGATHWSVANLR